MKVVNLTQGSPEWHAHRANHFNASDAPAMMGTSKFETRSELIHRLATGEIKEVSAELQRRFDDGHSTEAQARPIVEELIGEELFPAVGVSEEHPRLSASFDGITIDGETGYEHKRWNEALAESVRTGAIADDPAYWPQLEQQILVGGLKRVIFTASDGTEERMETYTYTPRPGRAEQIVAGWAQLEKDVAAYVPKVTKAEVVAAPVANLPAIVYEIERGTMALSSNLPAFRAATEALVERTKAPLVTDQDFADREALCKKMRDAEAMLKAKADEVVGQIADVATFSRELKDLAEMFRTTALASEKLVAAEKTNRRNAIQQGGEQALSKHIATLQARFAGRVQMPAYRADFAGAIKGKRTLESIQNAVDTLLAQGKIETNAMADAIDANLRALDELAADRMFLFADLQQIVIKPADDFRMGVQVRIAAHEAKEAARLQAETERIERETRERLERESREKAEAKERARREEEQRMAQQQAAQQPAPVVTATEASAAADLIERVLDADLAAPSPQVTTAAPADVALVGPKADTMATYAALRRQDEEQSPGVTGMANTLARSYGVDFVTALRWLQTINPADLADALKTATEAQEA